MVEEKTDTQPDAQTAGPLAVEDQTNTTAATPETGTPQPEDASDPVGIDLVNPTSAAEEERTETSTEAEARGEVVEMHPSTTPTSTGTSPGETAAGAEGEASEGAATESSAGEEGGETQAEGPTATPGLVVTEMEEPMGSGMLPPPSEVTTVGESAETQQPSSELDPVEEMIVPEVHNEAEAEGKENHNLLFRYMLNATNKKTNIGMSRVDIQY